MTLKVLVLSTNWIGDAVMTTPAITALAGLYPDAKIKVLARPAQASVFTGHPDVDEVIVADKKSLADPLIRPFRLAWRIRAEQFDIAVVFPNSFESALIPFLAGVPVRIGYNTDGRSILLTHGATVPGDKQTRHEVYYYLGLVDHLIKKMGLEKKTAPEKPRLVLDVPKEGEDGAGRILSSVGIEKDMLIGFNPGAAYGPAKRWPSGRFIELGKTLTKRHSECCIVVLGTEGENTLAKEICAGIGKRACNLAGRTSLVEAMGIINRLRLLVTNDSGLMHVAAALGTPLVALFGSTNPTTTGPWTEKAIVVSRILPCGPCLKRTCPNGFECMLGIGVEEVLKACERWL
ncbi:MAG: lipopolysaccharide heptosyltransferase II [Dissulfurimicrobium sp.]|uniref:lipopolysaccharide heptosyltransferase II n=1 Tax=Dissulfurimicrobium TaxID=1769732 RepID=UPI003C7192B6